jgi:hypothetical protein
VNEPFSELVERGRRGDAGATEALLRENLPGLRAFIRLRSDILPDRSELVDGRSADVASEDVDDVASVDADDFFQNRYQILVIGVELQAWVQANFPFLKVQ